MSFHDFITNLQSGNYSRPISQRTDEKGNRLSFCEQVLFSEEDAAKVNSLAEFDANISKLKNVRIRKVTGGGSFSSGTKAKFKLSLPIKAKYVSQITKNNPPETRIKPAWYWETVPGSSTTTPVYEEISISMMTLYHPSPLRIENVQADAVLSLNDPSDPTAKTIILIPLKTSNTPSESVTFFNKIAKYLTTIASPDPVTGLYAETNIPTGNEWNIKNVFWLDEPGSDNVSNVTDAFYTWMGAGSYKRVEVSRSATEIIYDWEPDGAQIRYFMLQTPVSISASDLSFLTMSLPATKAEEAIHSIPDPTQVGNPKILYKKATGRAAEAGCGIVRERMENQSQGDMVASLFTGGGVEDLLVAADGSSLMDIDTCDPFKNNAKMATLSPSMFTPTRAIAFLFNFMIIIALALGTWLAMFLIVEQNYDVKYKEFASSAGKVLGKIALNASARAQTTSYSVSQSLPNFSQLASLIPKKSAAAAAPA
jgi:hypothetical protein